MRGNRKPPLFLMKFDKTIEILEAKKAIMKKAINETNIIDKEIEKHAINSYWAFYKEYDEVIKILKRHQTNNQKKLKL